MTKHVSIIGSTGSIGVQALEVIDKLPGRFKITALSGGNNIRLLRKQAEKYKPKYICIKNEADADFFKGLGAEILSGEEGLKAAASLDETELALIAVSGFAGLMPSMAAIRNKKDIALANKETLVTAGDIVMKLAKENGVNVIPVDSEHSAIFQCIQGKRAEVKNLIITASGGPFLNTPEKELENVSFDEVLNHPRWKMGKKITVDSASLMNKGLEVIEAHHLFNIDYKNIKVVVHPQSYIHSAAEFTDGSIIAQIGLPSMHIPIQFALTYPDRVEGIKTESFDFIKAGKFEFFEPDYKKFPALELAIQAGKTGGTAPVCLNAANEEAVYAFLDKKIKFTDIYKITKKVYDDYTVIQAPSLEQILEEDKKVRAKMRDKIQ